MTLYSICIGATEIIALSVHPANTTSIELTFYFLLSNIKKMDMHFAQFN